MSGMFERESEMKLVNKVAVITRSSKGIGAAIANQLAAEGASIVVNYHTSKEREDKVVSEVIEAGGKAVAIGADVSNEKDMTQLGVP